MKLDAQNILEFKNFKGLFVNKEAGLVPTTVQDGVYATDISHVNTADGTINSSNGLSHELNGTADVTYDSVSGNTIGSLTYKSFNGVAPSTRLKLIFTDEGEMMAYNPDTGNYDKVLTGLYSNYDNTGFSWTAFNNFQGNSEDWTMLFVGFSGNNPLVWNGKIDKVASVAANTIVIDGGRSLYFDNNNNKNLVVNGTAYTYTSYTSGTKTFAGVSPDPNGVLSAGDVVVQKPEAAGITRYDALINTSTNGVLGVPDLFAEYKGRLAIGSTKTTNVALSGIADIFNFIIPGSPTASDPIHVKNIDGQGTPTGMFALRDSLVISKRDAMVRVKFVVDGSAFYIDQETFELRQNCGMPNKNAFTYADRDVIMMTTDGQLRLVSYPEDYALDVFKSQEVSVAIKPLLKRYGMTNVRMANNDRSVYVTCASVDGNANDTTFVLDSIDGTFDKQPVGFIGFMEVDGSLFGLKEGAPRVVKINDETVQNNDQNPILKMWQSPRLVLSKDFFRKKLETFFFKGSINVETILNVDLLYAEEGAWKTLSFQIKGDGSSNNSGDYIVSELPFSGYGSYEFGEYPFGSETTTEIIENNRDYVAFKTLSLNVRPYDIVVRFWSDAVDCDWRVYAFGFSFSDENDVPVNLILN